MQGPNNGLYGNNNINKHEVHNLEDIEAQAPIDHYARRDNGEPIGQQMIEINLNDEESRD